VSSKRSNKGNQSHIPIAFWICVALAAITLVAFWPATDARFVDLDDDCYVTNNPHVQTGLTAEFIAWALTTTACSNWHPLTWLSHILDYELYRLNPIGHHLTSLLLHVANVLLLFVVLRKLAGAIWPSAVVAALFAVHPLHVESVAWVSERKDVLSTLFLLLTMLAYVGYARRGGRARYLLVVVLYALGLMSKPMLVSLPLVLLILDWWPLGRMQGTVDSGQGIAGRSVASLVVEKLPLLVLAAVSCTVTYLIHYFTPDISRIGHLPLSLRVDNAILSCASYLVKTVWPVGLAVQYPHPLTSILIWQLIVSAVLLVGITVLAVLTRKRRPYVLAGWLWYVVTLLPVIGLVQTGEQGMADRYTYVPLVGVFIAIAWTMAGVTSRWVRAAVAAVVIAVLMGCTSVQVGHWRDSVSLFTRALAVTKDNYVAHMNLGVALEKQGRTEEARRQYEAALRLQPEYPRALYNYGVLLQRTGDLDKAEQYYRKALHSWPGFVDARYNLGVIYDELKKPENAIREYKAVLKLAPKYLQARNNLAITYYDAGRYSEAWEQVLAMRTHGYQPHPDFMKALSEKMPEPEQQ
jgi:Tfp pilus assembly protein PilF